MEEFSQRRVMTSPGETQEFPETNRPTFLPKKYTNSLIGETDRSKYLKIIYMNQRLTLDIKR